MADGLDRLAELNDELFCNSSNVNLGEIAKLTSTLSRVEENLKEEMSILEFVLDSITDGYWDWDIKRNYEYFSDKFKAQLGYKRLKPVPESWMNICNSEDLANAKKSVESHFKGETHEFKQLLRLTHKDGHEIQVLCRGKVVSWDADGSPIRMIGTHQIIKDE